MKNAKIRRFETVDTAETEITPKQLEALQNVDVRTVDKSTLVDIADVEIDMALPDRERIRVSPSPKNGHKTRGKSRIKTQR